MDTPEVSITNALEVKYTGKFIGEDRIASISITDITTPLGSTVLELTYESGKKKLMPEKGLVASVSDEKIDATKRYERLFNALSEECIKVVAEYDPPSFLFDRIGAKIELELKNHMQRAASILWFGSPDEYAPGFDSSNHVTLLMADEINKKFPPENV